MSPQREKAQIKANIAIRWIRLEYSNQGQKDENGEGRIMPEKRTDE